MLKKILLAAAALMLLAACALFTHPASLTLYAQSLPAVVHAQWDPPAVADNVIDYQVTLDGGAPVTVPNVIDASCSCIRSALNVPAFGTHSVVIVARNLLLSTDPTSTQSSTPATVSFTLAKAAVVQHSTVTR